MAVNEDRRDPITDKEKAEGSRENVNANPPGELPESSFGEGGGITNRPLDEEEKSQERVPPRGERKDDPRD